MMMMISAVSLAARSSRAAVTARGLAAAAAGGLPKIPLDVDGDVVEESQHATGRRGAELAGTRFNDKSIVPPAGAGTLANPILVPSNLEKRAVGFEDPETHAMYWFNLHKGKIAHVEMIDKYFKMVPY